MQNDHTLLRAILKNDLESFVHKSFHTVSPGVKYLYNWHIELICNKLRAVEKGEIKRLVINIPPRNLKSICVSIAWPAWLLGHNPSKKIMVASYSQALSNKLSQDCRLILSSSWFKDLFPQTRINIGENQKSKFVTNSRGFRFATSTGGTATGEGADYLIIDDPQNPNKINSKKYRDYTIEWFEQTFIPRLNDKKNGAIILVMQRLHSEDLTGYLQKKRSAQWDFLSLPAIFDKQISFCDPINKIIESGSALHSEREDIESLNRLKLELGEYVFSAQYLQAPVPSSGSMIKRSWLKYFLPDSNLEFSQIIQSWDTAIKAKDEHDYSVGITIGVHNNQYYLLDLLRIKVEFPDLLKTVQEFAKKWQPKVILVEDKASGQSLIQSLIKLIPFPIKAIKPKYDKITRFASVTPIFESGKFFIKTQASWKLDLEQELLSFPKSANDDQIDCISQALAYLGERRSMQVRLLS